MKEDKIVGQEDEKEYKIYFRKPEGKRPLMRPVSRQDDNIKMENCCTHVKKEMNFHVP
jgi:hypothetical protein